MRYVFLVSPPDRRETKKRRTRLAVLDAALELFSERGYRETTIAAIADRADVAPRTVTVHFPTKEELLFDAEPFSPDALRVALDNRPQGEPALTAFRTWMEATMSALDATDPDGRFWQRRALRAQIINAEPELRGRARAGSYRLEGVLAAAIGRDLHVAGTSLAPRLAALTTVVGLRELYETDEARALSSPPRTSELLTLIDQVITAARAGLAVGAGPLHSA
jgi:AcrR family transcriptional regulator